MESGTKQSETSPSLNENIYAGEVDSENGILKKLQGSTTLETALELSVSNKLCDETSNSGINCKGIVDEENTQIISDDDCSKEISSNLEMDCEQEKQGSNLEREVCLEKQSFKISEVENEGSKNITSADEKARVSEMMDETLVVASDEEIKDISDSNDKDVTIVSESDDITTNEKEERSFGDDSQATTVDVTEIDDQTPNSPEDLFATQSFEDAAKQNSPNCVMDSEDFIPSSLASQREISEKEEQDLAENPQVSSVQKRKSEEVVEENECKVRRLDLPSENHETEFSERKSSFGKLSQIEELNIGFPGESSREKEITKVSGTEVQTIEENNVVLCEETNESVVNHEVVNKDEKQLENYSDSLDTARASKDTRKSVEIIFSSFENSDESKPSVKNGQDLPMIPEENGEEYEDDEDSLHLHLSFSPSQLTQSFSETNTSKSKDVVQSKTDLAEKSSNGDTTYSSNSLSNSHSGTKSNSDCNSYSSKRIEQTLPDTITVDDTNDVRVTSSNRVTSTSNDVEVICTVKNSLSQKQSSDTDITVILDKNAENDALLSTENLKQREMNGTSLKRKYLETDDDREKIVVLDEVESTKNVAESDLCKRSRHMNFVSGERKTPDLPSLIPSKGKFESTPYDISKVTPANVSVSTIDSAPTSTGNLRDHEESSLSLRVVKRTFALHVRLHVNDDLRQVHSIEMVQCQSMEDFMSARPVSNFESSGGSGADVSRSSSPSSITSLGPFPLKSYRMSSSSTSTTSSGHSNPGWRSKSDEWHFAAPLKRAPSRSSRIRNIQCSPEFEQELFELAERTWHLNETEAKSLPVTVKNVASQMCSDVSSLPEGLDDVKDLPQENTDAETHVETPKSSKKMIRGNKTTRSSARSLVSKIIKESTEEEQLPMLTSEKETPNVGESSGSQRRARKLPSRSSKRTAGSTPSTPVAAVESKISTTPVASSGRLRRNRNDPVAIEKTDQNFQEHVYDWNTEGCTKLVAEAPVFARWTDKKYYPGRIKENTKDGRWIIEFDDKTVRPLKEEFIIPVNILIKGQIVFAYDGDEYEQGIIVEFKLKDGEVQYGVDLDSGRKLFVPRSRLFMSEDQARLLRENLDPKSPTTSSPALTTVSCDNIVHHKRPRSIRVLFGNSSPSVSGAKRPSHDNSCSSSVSDSNDKGSTSVLDEVCGVDPEIPSSFPEILHTPSGRGKGPGRIKNKSRTPRRNATAHHMVSDSQEPNKFHEILGPIPLKGSEMFSGKCFLLTYSVIRPLDVSKTTTKSTKRTELIYSSDYSDDAINSKIPFVKDHLKQQLEAGGGKVYENFEDVPEDQYQNCFLVADRPSLTAKYIQCLASGIKIIKHEWVIEEAKGSNRSVASARLPAGWNLEEQCYVPSEATIRTRKQKPLNKKEVGIVNESLTFIKFWERILELLGANVRRISPGSPEQDREFSGVDVILTDSTCPPEVQDRAREWSIPLVSTVWVTQTLINWRIRSYSGHSHYRYDYCTSD